MKRSLVTLLIFSLLSLASAETRLMFGDARTPDSQRKFLNYRFISSDDAMFSHRLTPRPWFFNIRGGAAWMGTNGSLPADTLLEHGVGCRNSTLTIPWTGQSAHLRIWIGDWFFGWRRMWGTDPEIRLTVNGKTCYSDRMTPENCFREWCQGEEYVYHSQDSPWDRLVKPILREIIVKTTPVEGKITLKMNNILLTAIDLADSSEHLLQGGKEVEQARRKMFTRRYPWKPEPDEQMPPTKERDCLLFQKSGLDTIYPWSRPRTNELCDTIRIFAARGEQEMMRFGVLPLRNLEHLEIKISDFQNASGRILKTNTIADFWRERYKERGSEGTQGKINAMWRLHPMSYVLQKYAPIDADAGVPRMYVLDINVPVEAEAADYFADLEILSSGRLIRRARLQLKVLPFQLDYAGSAVYNFQMGYTNWALYSPAHKAAQVKKNVAQQFDFLSKYHFHNNYFTGWGYGMPGIYKFGQIQGSPGKRIFTQTPDQEATMDWWMKRIKKDGTPFVMLKGGFLFMNCGWTYTNVFNLARQKKLTPKIISKWNQDLVDIERLVGQITRLFHRKGYPEPYWYFTGELDNFGMAGVKEALKLAQAIRRAGGISLVTINGPLAYKHTPANFDHIWANPATPVDEQLVANIRKHGHQFGTHNSGDTRFQAGIQFWRTGGEGRHQETQFYTDFMLPYCLLPWNYNTAQVYPAPDGTLRPSIPFLNYRDGRDDYLYLHTLENAIAGATDSPARQDGLAFLARLRKKVHFDPRMYHTEKFDGIEGTASIAEDEWNSTSIERYRWKIAMLIMKLQESGK